MTIIYKVHAGMVCRRMAEAEAGGDYKTILETYKRQSDAILRLGTGQKFIDANFNYQVSNLLFASIVIVVKKHTDTRCEVILLNESMGEKLTVATLEKADAMKIVNQLQSLFFMTLESNIKTCRVVSVLESERFTHWQEEKTA